MMVTADKNVDSSPQTQLIGGGAGLNKTRGWDIQAVMRVNQLLRITNNAV